MSLRERPETREATRQKALAGLIEEFAKAPAISVQLAWMD
jgi:hypothetical protein